MTENKYKPRAGFWALGGLIIMLAGFLFYIFIAPLTDSRDITRLLITSSVIFGYGMAMTMLSLWIYNLEGRIIRQEKVLEQKNP